MAYYRYHLFFCTNQRPDGRPCCAQQDAAAARAYLKQRCKAMGLADVGGVRVNTAGCLNRCAEGPVLVVYPEGIWYRYRDHADLDTILQQHLLAGQPVAHLRLPDHAAQ